jgi:hypothetical protein
MSTSIRDLILNADDLQYKDVPIPQWNNVTVRVMGFTDEQLGAWRAKTAALKAKQRTGDADLDFEIQMKHMRAELLVKCLRDPETGQRIFKDNDAPKLAQKHAGVMQALDALATTLSDLDLDFRDQVKKAETDFSEGQS